MAAAIHRERLNKTYGADLVKDLEPVFQGPAFEAQLVGSPVVLPKPLEEQLLADTTVAVGVQRPVVITPGIKKNQSPHRMKIDVRSQVLFSEVCMTLWVCQKRT
jgi:hypothetical protein